MHALPESAARHIFLLLPVPDRLLCRGVSRAWRAFLACPALWRMLDLSAARLADHLTRVRCGGSVTWGYRPWLRLQPAAKTAEERFLQLLGSALAASRFSAEQLDVSGHRRTIPGKSIIEALCAALRNSSSLAASLQSLRLVDTAVTLSYLHDAGSELDPVARRRAKPPSVTAGGGLQSLVQMAPALREVVIAAALPTSGGRSTSPADNLFHFLGARASDRPLSSHTSATFAAVRVQSLQIVGEWRGDDRVRTMHLLNLREILLASALRAAAPLHRPWLQRLEWVAPHLSDPVCCGALADAVVGSGVRALLLCDALFSPVFTPHLSRMLRDGSLRELVLMRERGQCSFCALLHDGRIDPESEADFAELCDALRTSRLLEMLVLRRLRPAPSAEHARRLAALVAALQAHPTLRRLEISGDQGFYASHATGGAWAAAAAAAAEEALRAAGGAVAGLLAANSPALTALDISECGFGAAALGRVFDGLRGNTHVVSLSCSQGMFYRGEWDARFVRERLLPAVRACASLRVLDWDPAASRRTREAEEQRAALAAATQRELLLHRLLPSCFSIPARPRWLDDPVEEEVAAALMSR